MRIEKGDAQYIIITASESQFEVTNSLFLPLVAWCRVRPIHHRRLFRLYRRTIKYLLKPFCKNWINLYRMSSDATFQFPFGDDYWGRLLYQDATIYEPEIEYFLRGCANLKYKFIDCGANFGYWSIKVSSRDFGTQTGIAIEACTDSFNVLRRNLIVNRANITCLRRAVWSESGLQKMIGGKKHEGRSLTQGELSAEAVETITIDDLVRDRGLENELIVVKLDVEGAEQMSFMGGQKTRASNSVWIYEDHGKDCNHSISRFLIERGTIYFYKNLRFTRVTEIKDLDLHKTSPYHGYNFFYTESDFWRERLESFARPEGASDYGDCIV